MTCLRRAYMQPEAQDIVNFTMKCIQSARGHLPIGFISLMGSTRRRAQTSGSCRQIKALNIDENESLNGYGNMFHNESYVVECKLVCSTRITHMRSKLD